MTKCSKVSRNLTFLTGLATISFVVLAALSLSACGTTGEQVLTNLQGCKRQYSGVVSGGLLTPGSFSGSVEIDCPPGAGQPAPPGTVAQVAPPFDPG